MSASSSSVEARRPRRPGAAAARVALALTLLMAAASCHKQAAALPAPTPGAQAAPAERFYDLDGFLVNLANPEGDRYVRTTISLGYTRPAAAAEIKAQVPRIRDAVIDVLGAQTTADLINNRGRDKVKQQILDRLKALLPDAGFDGVYFQLFTFQ